MSASRDEAPAAPEPHAWWVLALVPALCDLDWRGAVAWAAALLVGGALAAQAGLRWVAVGWAASALVPGAPLAGVAAGGLGVRAFGALLKAGALGVALAVVLPGEARNAGLLLLGGGALASVLVLRAPAPEEAA